MSSAPVSKGPPTKPKKDREKERERKEKQAQVSERLKTVVRRLPANLPEGVFWQSVNQWVSDETITWKAFFPGKLKRRVNKENIPSRAYIAFKTEEQLAMFGKDYDGHLFRDKAGNESHAIVEYAPYQKVPAEKKKPDARNATIEKDEDYISFLESLNAQNNLEPISLETLIAASQPLPPPKTTPLLEALKAERSAHKDKESILRNHAHYKDQVPTTASARKEDFKKKGILPQKSVEPSSSSKKPSKKTSAPPPNASGTKSHSITIAPKNASGPSAPPRSPKANRTSKPPQQIKAPPANKPGILAGVPPPPTIEVDGTQSVQGSASATPAAVPPPRRMRPMIGLGSRQFEAALNGVGVGAAGDRKSRREREKEKEGPKEGGVAGGVGEAKAGPPSPRRDRGQRSKDTGGGAAVSGAPTVKIPSILQRTSPAVVPREMPRIDDVNPPVVSRDVMATQGGGRGSRRGRGRGRGVTRGG